MGTVFNDVQDNLFLNCSGLVSTEGRGVSFRLCFVRNHHYPHDFALSDVVRLGEIDVNSPSLLRWFSRNAKFDVYSTNLSEDFKWSRPG